jgi:hypothetical protein
MSDLIKIIPEIIGLESDFETEIANINKHIPLALSSVGADMEDNLQKHLYYDWYLANTPKEYKRRTDNPKLGTPLGSEKNINYVAYGNNLLFTYTPTGEHEDEYWHTSDGDELIINIQTGELVGTAPPRPFWNNFVEEQQQKLIVTFAEAMRPYNVIREKDEKIDLSEFLLDSGAEQLHMFGLNGKNNEEEGKLPY